MLRSAHRSGVAHTKRQRTAADSCSRKRAFCACNLSMVACASSRCRCISASSSASAARRSACLSSRLGGGGDGAEDTMSNGPPGSRTVMPLSASCTSTWRLLRTMRAVQASAAVSSSPAAATSANSGLSSNTSPIWPARSSTAETANLDVSCSAFLRSTFCNGNGQTQ